MFFQLEILQICLLQKLLLQYIHRLLYLPITFWVFMNKKISLLRSFKLGMMVIAHALYMLGEKNWCLLSLIIQGQKRLFTKIKLFQAEFFIISNLFYSNGFIGILHLKECGLVKMLYFNQNLNEIIFTKNLIYICNKI